MRYSIKPDYLIKAFEANSDNETVSNIIADVLFPDLR